MSEAFDSIMQGLKDAEAYLKGDRRGSITHYPDGSVLDLSARAADVDVASIRAKTGLTQSAFAKSIGVAKPTLLNWEQGRRRPTGPARVLLAMIARRPSVVEELLRA
jgi:putative transcriptional regulator